MFAGMGDRVVEVGHQVILMTEFVDHSEFAEEVGFAGVMAGPLVRSSYRAGRLYAQAMAHHGREIPAAMAHLANEGSASQEASSVLSRLAH